MLKGIRKVAWEEAKCFFLNSKLILIVFELIFFCETFLVHVKDLCQMSGMQLSFFEPYLLICSSDMYFLAIPLVFLVLLSGFPSKRSYNYFSLIRISRLQWLIGELVFLVLSAISYMLILGLGILVYMGKYVRLDYRWSGYMLDFNRQFPELFRGNEDYFLDADMMTHGSPMIVCIHSVLLMMCMLLCVALVQMTFALFRKKYIGMLLVVGLTLASALSIYSTSTAKWIFPMTHTNFGVHFDGFRAKVFMELWVSYLYFGILFAVFLITDFVMAKKVNMEAENGV